MSGADNVNHPDHYTQGGIECIDAIKSACGVWYEGYLRGNVLKYVWRYDKKGKPAEDLRKARWYLDRLIDEAEGGGAGACYDLSDPGCGDFVCSACGFAACIECAPTYCPGCGARVAGHAS